MGRECGVKVLKVLICIVTSAVFALNNGILLAQNDLTDQQKNILKKQISAIGDNAEVRQNRDAGGEDESHEKGSKGVSAAVESVLGEGEIFFEEDLEAKLITLIVLEKDEEVKERLNETLKELRAIKRGLIAEDTKAREAWEKGWQWQREASQIEKAYAEDLPMDIPRQLGQFGYDIFPDVEELDRGEEGQGERREDRNDSESLDRLSLLRDVLIGKDAEPEGEQFGSSVPGSRRTWSFDKLAVSRAVGGDYILGPGDVLWLRMWGAIEGTSELEVDSEGKIFLPRKGPVYVWGKKLSEAKSLIDKFVSESYSNVKSEVTMGRIKTISVFVLGDVKVAGAHVLTPQNTLFHALYMAGGPTKTGSLRSIRLIRKDDEEKVDIDLYKLLLDGDSSVDVSLKAGDVIFVPPIGNVAGVAGNVKRPAIYEINNGMKVSDLLSVSGGIAPMGYGKRLQVERVERHTRKVVVDLKFEQFSELESSASNIEVRNGDLVLVFPVASTRENIVKISGAVKMPGSYELVPDMKVKDLLNKAEGVKRGAYLKRGEVMRSEDAEIDVFNVEALLDGDESQNVELEECDEVKIYYADDVLPAHTVNISGNVYRPGEYPLYANMKISDLLFVAGGAKPSTSLGNAELFKVVLGQAPQVIKVDLKPIINQKKGARDLLLSDGDHLFVREDQDWVEKKTIMLSGEIKYPGRYVAMKGETLSSIIARAGGFTSEAFLEGAVFTRESVSAAEQEAKTRFVQRQERQLMQEEMSLSGRFVYSEAEREAARESLRHRRELLQHLAETEVPGRLLIDLALKGGFAGTKYDVGIEDGDRLHIPQPPSAIQVLGGVYTPSSITYQQGRGIEYYLGKVGGLSENADKNNIYIVKANGETRRHFTRAMVVGTGDLIVVPEQFKYTIPPGVLFRDALTTMSQILTGAAMVRVIAE